MPALVVCVTVAALGASQAGGAPTARSAKAANSIIGTATNVTPPDDLWDPVVKIEGKIRAAGHNFAHRQCRRGRMIHIQTVRLSGAMGEVGDFYPTPKSGRFDYETYIEYGGTDSQGRFYDNEVPWSGGMATFVLSTGKIKVRRNRQDILRSYTCRPLRLTLQVSIPPLPGFPEIP